MMMLHRHVKTIWGREPVLILAFIQAMIALLSVFVLHWNAEQTGVMMAFAAAILGLIARSQVSPVRSKMCDDARPPL